MPTGDENSILHSLDPAYTEVSEMSREEREFLNAIILRTKPRKALEAGVSAGASSVIMLNALKNIPGAALHSIDYSPRWYRNKSRKTGFIVDSYPALARNWKLYTGSLSFAFMEEIGGEIDLCLIDTVHSNPGEILDTLMILPFLKDDAVIVFHDVNLHTMSGKVPECSATSGITNNLLFSAIAGTKYAQGHFVPWNPADKRRAVYFPNIGAIRISAETKRHVFEIFNLLTLKWNYLLAPEEEQGLAAFIEKHYGPFFAGYLKQVTGYQRACFETAPPVSVSLRQIAKRLLGRRLVTAIRAARNK